MVAFNPLLAVFHFFLLSAAIPLAQSPGSSLDSTAGNLSSPGDFQGSSYENLIPRDDHRYRISLVVEDPIGASAYFLVSTRDKDNVKLDTTESKIKSLKSKYAHTDRFPNYKNLVEKASFTNYEKFCDGSGWTTFMFRLADEGAYTGKDLVSLSMEVRSVMKGIANGGKQKGSSVSGKLPEVAKALDGRFGG